MLDRLENFPKNQFLSEGAIYGHGDQIYLMWGAEPQTSRRPSGLAIWAPDFFLKDHGGWVSFSNYLKISRDQAKQIFQTKEFKCDWQTASKSLFEKQFHWTQAWIADGVISKAVPYVFDSCNQKLEHGDIESMMASALCFEQGYLYGFWQTGDGILGLTPETLIEQTEVGRFQTMALAGTCERNAYLKDPQKFLNDLKEVKEHEIVVDEIVKSLVESGEVSIKDRRVHCTPHLAHLFTPIELVSESEDLESLVQKLHPTPALGCSPREKAFEIMARFNELCERTRFGAPFAISIGHSRAHVLVAIRNIIWDSDSFRIGSGCGVVEESDLEKEWQELSNKRNSVKKILGFL